MTRARAKLATIKNSVGKCKKEVKVDAECVYVPNHPYGETILAGGFIRCSIHAFGADDGEFRFDVAAQGYATGLGYRTFNATYFNPELMESFVEFENTFENYSAYYFTGFTECQIRDLRNSNTYNGTISEYECFFHDVIK